LVTDFDLNIGTGKGTINLNEYSFIEFKTNIGTGQTNIDFSGVNSQKATVDFEVGTGQLVLKNVGNANLSSLSGSFGTGSVDIDFGDGITQTEMFSKINGGTGKELIVKKLTKMKSTNQKITILPNKK